MYLYIQQQKTARIEDLKKSVARTSRFLVAVKLLSKMHR
jgi:hypothetical protein